MLDGRRHLSPRTPKSLLCSMVEGTQVLGHQKSLLCSMVEGTQVLGHQKSLLSSMVEGTQVLGHQKSSLSSMVEGKKSILLTLSAALVQKSSKRQFHPWLSSGHAKIQNPSDIKELSKLIDRRHKDLSFWQLCLLKALDEIVRQLPLII